MSKTIIQEEIIEKKCDNCNCDIPLDKLGDGILIKFGYPTDLDGNELHFCCDKCFERWFLSDYIDRRI